MRLGRVISLCVITTVLCLALVAARFAFAAPGTSALVGYWKLDETTQGASAVDSSGYNNTGSGVGTSGGPSYSTDVPYTTFPDSHSANFNGYDQYVNCGNTPSGLPTGSSDRTIMGWVKATSFGGSGRTVAGWGNDTGGELSELEVANSKIEFHGNGNDVVGGTTLSTGQWYHLATTVASDGTVKLYVNGVLDGTGSVTLNTTEANCKIGRQPDYYGQYFDGLIDDVRIYSRVLSPTEIANIASGNEPTATWTGTTSTDFETASNWNTGLIPEPFTKFIIPSTSNNPVLSASEAFGGVNIQSGASLDLNGHDLTMGDVATNSGTIIARNSETVSNFTMKTGSGTVLYNNTSDATGLSLGDTYNNVIFNDGLVGYFKFDEGSGTTANDSSGYVHTGTITGASYSTTIPTVHFADSHSLNFDGSSYVDIARPVQDDFSICAWIKTTGVGGGDSHFDLMQIADAEVANVDTGDFGFGINSTGHLSYGNGGAGGLDFEKVTSSNVVNNDAWRQVCVTRQESDGAVKLYIDGTMDGSGTLATGTLNGNPNLRIGGYQDTGSAGKNFVGLMDDVRIYDKVLSGTKIARLGAGDEPGTSIATTTLNHDLTINGNLVLNSGTLDASTSNYTITDTGNFENNGGVFTARQGTVTLNATDGQMINSSNTFYNLTRSPISSDHLALTFGAGSTQTITNTLSLKGTNGGWLGLFSSTNGTQWKIDPQGTRDISYASPYDSDNINVTPIAYSATNNYGTNLTNWETTAPTPTPTPGNANNSSSQSLSNASAPTCSAMPSIGAPDLYQLDPSTNSVTLYFAPPSSSISTYNISYGTANSADTYAVQALNMSSLGAVKYAVNDLLPGTTYYFKVQAANGCPPGPWSKTSSVTTKTNAFTSYFIPLGGTTSVPQSSSKKITIKKSTLTAKPMPKTAPHTASGGTSATPTPTPILQNLYSVDVTVKNGDKPVVGATVTMHSVQKQAITDGQGVAHFSKVEQGEHTVLLAYQGYTGQEHVKVTGQNKNLALTLQIQLNGGFSQPSVIAVIAGLGVIILILLVLLFRRKTVTHS